MTYDTVLPFFLTCDVVNFYDIAYDIAIDNITCII